MDDRRPSLSTPPVTPNSLSPRQREVAVLIAQGLSNAEIGQQLTITVGTAANHVEAVLRRLGVSGRVQVATWAIAQGLVTVVHSIPVHGAANDGAEAAF